MNTSTRHVAAFTLALLLVACDSDEPAPDPLAPGIPTGFVAQAGDGEVVLTWNANPEDDLAHYNVYQGEESGSLSKVAEVLAGTETYTAAGLANGTTYFFVIDAENTAGRRSVRTDEVSATPGTQQPPPPSATFEGLGDLPGGEYRSIPSAVSADGSVVVGRSDIPLNPNQGFNREAFRWENGTLEGLGFLPGASAQSAAAGLSADGTVIVGSSDNSEGNMEAFRFQNGVMEGLGDLGHFSSAGGVSANGSVVVGYGSAENDEGDLVQEAFRWEDGEIVRLGDLPGGIYYSRARAVSADGSVVVGESSHSVVASSGSYLAEGFRWTEADGMVGLGHLTLPDSTHSGANDVSADGSVIVGASYSVVTRESQAYRWENGEMEGLGDLPGRRFYSSATAVSADGAIVLGSSATENGTEAFFWTEEGGMQNLNVVLENNYGLDLAGWTLTSVADISDDGTVIVGAGTNPDGNTEAWRVVLEEPVGGAAKAAL